MSNLYDLTELCRAEAVKRGGIADFSAPAFTEDGEPSGTFAGVVAPPWMQVEWLEPGREADAPAAIQRAREYVERRRAEASV